MSGIFKVWLSEEEYQLFKQYGYYTKKYLDTNLRIIAMNCFYCDIMNFFIIKNPTDPGNQFKWMEEVLRQAEKDREYVYIIGHIPPGDSTYTSECSKRYNALVDRFSNIIRGQFYGHTHYDEFRLIPEYFNKTNIAGVILTAPSLTSYTYKNPSFRVYEVDSNSMIVKDYEQYRFNITEANLNPDLKPTWKVSYTATKSLGVKHLNDYKTLAKNIDRMEKEADWFNIVTDYFYAEGTEKKSYITNKKLAKFFTCRFRESIFDDYMRCTSYRTWDYSEYINRFIETLSGKWYIKHVDHSKYYHDHSPNQTDVRT